MLNEESLGSEVQGMHGYPLISFEKVASEDFEGVLAVEHALLRKTEPFKMTIGLHR